MQTLDFSDGGVAATNVVEAQKSGSGTASDIGCVQVFAESKVSYDEVSAMCPNKFLPGLTCRRLRFAEEPDTVVEYTIQDFVSDDGGSTNSAIDSEDLGSADMLGVFTPSWSDSDGSSEAASDDEDCIITAPVPGQEDAFLEVLARVRELESQEKSIFKEWDKREEMRQQLASSGCAAAAMPTADALDEAIEAAPTPLVPAISHVRRFSHSRSRSMAEPDAAALF